MVALIVPVLSNFKGLADLMRSVDEPVQPIIIPNWIDNIGVAASWNTGLQLAIDMKEDYAIIVNDDVVLTPRVIYSLVRSLSEVDLVSAVGTFTGKTGLETEGVPDFSCFAVRPQEFTDKFGWFDTHFYPAYFEDNDMLRRIRLAGGTTALALHATIYHEGSVTQNMGGNGDTDPRVVSHDQFRANRAHYKAKWGGGPHEEVYKTPFNMPHLSIKDM